MDIRLPLFCLLLPCLFNQVKSMSVNDECTELYTGIGSEFIENTNFNAGTALNIFVDFPITTTGFIDAYEVYISSNGKCRTGEVYVDAWEPVSDGNSYRHKGSVKLNITSRGYNRLNMSSYHQLLYVRPRYVLGLHYSELGSDNGVICYQVDDVSHVDPLMVNKSRLVNPYIHFEEHYEGEVSNILRLNHSKAFNLKAHINTCDVGCKHCVGDCNIKTGFCYGGCNGWWIGDTCATKIGPVTVSARNVFATPTGSLITFSWSADIAVNPDTTSYYYFVVRYKEWNNGTGAYIDSPKIPFKDDSFSNHSYTVFNLKHGTLYEYVIRSERTLENMMDHYETSPATVKTLCEEPETPSSVDIKLANDTFTLIWQSDLRKLDSGCSSKEILLYYKYRRNDDWLLGKVDEIWTDVDLPAHGNNNLWAKLVVLNDARMSSESATVEYGASFETEIDTTESISTTVVNWAKSSEYPSTFFIAAVCVLILGVVVAVIGVVCAVVCTKRTIKKHTDAVPRKQNSAPSDCVDPSAPNANEYGETVLQHDTVYHEIGENSQKEKTGVTNQSYTSLNFR